jgi:hypothetical protein
MTVARPVGGAVVVPVVGSAVVGGGVIDTVGAGEDVVEAGGPVDGDVAPEVVVEAEGDESPSPDRTTRTTAAVTRTATRPAATRGRRAVNR